MVRISRLKLSTLISISVGNFFSYLGLLVLMLTYAVPDLWLDENWFNSSLLTYIYLQYYLLLISFLKER